MELQLGKQLRLKQEFYSLFFVRLCEDFFKSPGRKFKMYFISLSKLIPFQTKNISKGN